MSLVFGGAASNRVTVVPDASINSLGDMTVLAWIYPTSAAISGLVTKGTAGGNNRRSFEVAQNVVQSVYATVDCATSSASSQSQANTVVSNQWQVVGMRYDDTTKTIDLFWGDVATLIAEVTYDSQTAGSGAVGNNDAADQFIGCFGSGSSGSFAGRIGAVAIFNEQLALAEMETWQFSPYPNKSSCVLDILLGQDGTGTQRDLSGNGNNGTITGATLGADDPQLFQPDWERTLENWATTVGGGATTSPWYYYAQQ